MAIPIYRDLLNIKCHGVCRLLNTMSGSWEDKTNAAYPDACIFVFPINATEPGRKSSAKGTERMK